MESKKQLPQDFEPVKYIESEKINSLFEIYKSPEWDKTVPQIMDLVDKCKDGKEEGIYPYFTRQNAVQYLPKLNVPTEIFTNIQLKELHSKLPYYHQYTNLKRIFSISVDGCALRSFYNKCEGVNNSIIAVKDDEGNVFGAYASEAFKPKFTFYKDNRIKIFNSTGQNDHYMYGDNDQICFGCSDDYFSLALTNDFLSGYSKATKTYDNESLNKRDKFTIVKLELWGFEGN